MIRWIVESSLKLRYLVVTIAAVLMVLGIFQLRNMPVDVLPEFSPPLVEVQTEALGLSAEEVEALITVPLEADLLNGVAWLDKIYSESVTGLSSIILIFEPGTDPIRARQMVQERLTQAHALPNVSKPPTMLQPLSSSSRFLMVGLSSEDLSLIEMSVLARWNIKPRLLGVHGVANVSIWGQRERQLQVQVDPEQLQAEGVTLQQIINTTGNALWVSPLTFLNASTPGTGGWIDTPNQRLGVRHILPITSAEELAKVTIVDSPELRLGDVANVVESHQPLIGDATINDGPSLLLVIEKFPGENTLAVTREVEEALAALEPGLQGMQLDATVFRPATYIELAIDNLTNSLLIGALLVVLVLLAFLWNWRVALISAVVIPVSLLTAVLVLYLRGATLNTMVLAGLVIALGAIIDDAIVDVENIARRLRQHRLDEHGRSAAAVVLEAATEVRGVTVYATLILLLVMLPAFFLPGLFGTFFQPLVISYGLALLASLLVAMTITPALSLILLANTSPERRESPLLQRLRDGYDRLLARTIQRPRMTYVAMGVLVLASIVAWPFFRQNMLPTFQETDLLIPWEGAPGTSRQAMNRITAQAVQELRALPGVRNVSAHVGRAVTSDQVVGIHSGELWVSIDPAADYRATVAAVGEVIEGYPGLSRDVETYLKERIREGQAGNDEEIVVRVFGADLDVLRNQAEQVRQLLATTEGIVDAQAVLQPDQPQVEIRVDLAAAEQYGVKPGDVRRAATTLLSGIEVGSLFEEQKVFDVVVWGTPDTRNSLTNIRELLIDTPDGSYVRLGSVADVRVVSVPTIIKRDAVSRYIDVEADVRGRSLGAVASDIENRLEQVDFPLEYHAELLGGFEARRAAQQRAITIAIASAIAIFLLLQAAYDSWRLATITFVSLPTAVAGGVLAAFVTGATLSIGTLIGLVTVLGIAVRNGIMLVHHFQYLQEHEGEPFGPALVRRGALDRLVPILMTAIAMGLALVPIVLFGQIAGHEILYPMAIVILGGLVTSSLLNLFIIPSLYLRFAMSPEPETPPPVGALAAPSVGGN